MFSFLIGFLALTGLLVWIAVAVIIFYIWMDL